MSKVNATLQRENICIRPDTNTAQLQAHGCVVELIWDIAQGFSRLALLQQGVTTFFRKSSNILSHNLQNCRIWKNSITSSFCQSSFQRTNTTKPISAVKICNTANSVYSLTAHPPNSADQGVALAVLFPPPPSQVANEWFGFGKERHFHMWHITDLEVFPALLCIIISVTVMKHQSKFSQKRHKRRNVGDEKGTRCLLLEFICVSIKVSKKDRICHKICYASSVSFSVPSCVKEQGRE